MRWEGEGRSFSADAARFTFEKQADPAEFIAWLLNTLHKEMGTNDSIIHQTLQGKVQVTSRDLRRLALGKECVGRASAV